MQCLNGHSFTRVQMRWGVRERVLLCRTIGQKRAGDSQPHNCYHMFITRSLLLKWEGTELPRGTFRSPLAICWHPQMLDGRLEMDYVIDCDLKHPVIIFSPNWH